MFDFSLNIEGKIYFFLIIIVIIFILMAFFVGEDFAMIFLF